MLTWVKNKVFDANKWFDRQPEPRRFWVFFFGFAIPFSAALAFPITGFLAILLASLAGLVRIWYFGECDRRKKE